MCPTNSWIILSCWCQTILTWTSCQIRKIVGCACAGTAGKFSLPLQVCDPNMLHNTCVMHVPWCMPGSLTSGFLWSWWRRKLSRHFLCMRNWQFYVSDKRPMLYMGSLFCFYHLHAVLELTLPYKQTGNAVIWIFTQPLFWANKVNFARILNRSFGTSVLMVGQKCRNSSHIFDNAARLFQVLPANF